MCREHRRTAGAEPQVDVTFQSRTLASFRCEGSFAFLQRVSVGFLRLAYKIVQLCYVPLKSCLALNQDNRTARRYH